MLNITPMINYLSDAATPMEVARSLDEIAHQYTQLMLSNCDKEVPGNADANNLAQLRELRNVMLKIDGSCKLSL